MISPLTFQPLKSQPSRGFAWSVLAVCLSFLLANSADAGLPGLTKAEGVAKFFRANFPSSVASISSAKAKLSETTLFTDLVTLTPRTGLIPYGVNSPMWADGAKSRRWIAIPNDGTVNNVAEQIGYSATGDWTFPIGTVIVKHFDLPINDTDPSQLKKVETQILVIGTDSVWYALTYRWKEDESDADLITSATDTNRVFSIESGSRQPRSQTWTYLTRAKCATCHSPAIGTVLGVRTHQLNGNQFYSKSGRTANQLYTLSSLKFITTPIDEAIAETLPRSAAHDNFLQPLEKRARSYLDANCAHCHRFDGVQKNFDLRFATTLGNTKIINNAPSKSYGIPGEGLVRPQQVAKSLIYHLTSISGTGQMPPLARTRRDDTGLLVVEEWINQLSGYQTPGDPGLRAQYFNGTEFQLKKTEQTEPNVDHDWGTNNPLPTVNADNFSTIFSGKIYAPVQGTYTFTVDSDDGVKLWVNNLQIITGWNITNPTRQLRSGLVTLTAGKYYDFVLNYHEFSGTGLVKVRWSAPGLSENPIPASRFYLTASNAPAHPVAVNDTATVKRGRSLNVVVLSNDTDAENNIAPVSVNITKEPEFGTATVEPNGSITYQHDFSKAGTSDSIVYTVMDSSGLVSNRAQLTLTLQPDAADWIKQYFPASDPNSPTLSDWDADPDKDGQSNVLEYACNSDPRNPSVTVTPKLTTPDPSIIQLEFPKRPYADVTYEVEICTKPDNWILAGDAVSIIEDTMDHLVIQLPINTVENPKQFVRLRATIIP